MIVSVRSVQAEICCRAMAGNEPPSCRLGHRRVGVKLAKSGDPTTGDGNQDRLALVEDLPGPAGPQSIRRSPGHRCCLTRLQASPSWCRRRRPRGVAGRNHVVHAAEHPSQGVLAQDKLLHVGRKALRQLGGSPQANAAKVLRTRSRSASSVALFLSQTGGFGEPDRDAGGVGVSHCFDVSVRRERDGDVEFVF